MNLLAGGGNLNEQVATSEAEVTSFQSNNSAGVSGNLQTMIKSATPMPRNTKLGISIPLVFLFIILVLLLIVGIFQKRK